MLIRRDRRPTTRYLAIRVGLLFFGAGLWIAGVVVEDYRITAVAIVVVVAALFLGLIARRTPRSEAEESMD